MSENTKDQNTISRRDMLKTSAALAAAPMFFTKGAYAKDFTNNPVSVQNL
jgi:hypothetical protein